MSKYAVIAAVLALTVPFIIRNILLKVRRAVLPGPPKLVSGLKKSSYFAIAALILFGTAMTVISLRRLTIELEGLTSLTEIRFTQSLVRNGLSLLIGLIAGAWAAAAGSLILKFNSLSSLAATPNPLSGPGTGTLHAVKKNFFLSLRHAPSWRLVVEYKDLKGTTHFANSEPIWDTNPTTWAKENIPVPLFLDRADSSRAYVRLDAYFAACNKPSK